ncbi:DUF3073 domain-containing protein [Tomitella biformata]|uniref:DUF3073 domain-containing protein n=1 Tax=Tomitella biformata TaxID=630403 RepID=UPI000465C136|nr:DUF3073 domain-containing protein [Tomitella biformata]
MGRGRAKAKQTKVARKLKYSSPTTDFDNLQQELAGSSPAKGLFDEDRSSQGGPSTSDSDDYDKWSG